MFKIEKLSDLDRLKLCIEPAEAVRARESCDVMIDVSHDFFVDFVTIPQLSILAVKSVCKYYSCLLSFWFEFFTPRMCLAHVTREPKYIKYI